MIKDILYRAAERKKIPTRLVANKLLRTPPSPYIRALQVPRGIDVADINIVRERAGSGYYCGYSAGGRRDGQGRARA